MPILQRRNGGEKETFPPPTVVRGASEKKNGIKIKKGLTNVLNCAILLRVKEAEHTPFSPCRTARRVNTYPSPGRGLGVCGDCVFRTFFFMYWRCRTISAKEMQINDEIRAKEVRLVGADGEQLGILSLENAQKAAYDKGMDLVLMAPQATPPVCRIMDYGKYRFERDKKEKEARKKQQTVEVKEIQLSCRIDTHDFETKVNHARKFLTAGNKVKVILRFKGREMSHQELGREMLSRFEEACKDLGSVDKKPTLEGKFMSMMVNPLKPTSKKD